MVSCVPWLTGGAARHLGGRKLFLVVALGLAALRCWGLATVQMPFNGWDEVAHLAAAFHVYKHGRMPSPDDGLDPELVPFIKAHPHPARSASILDGVRPPLYKGDDPRASAAPDETAPFKQYQAQHGPLFYYMMAALLPGTDADSLLAWADLGRLCNSVFLLGFVGLWYVVLCRLVPPGRLSWLPEGATLLLVGFSYLPYTFVRFANDGLSLFLSSLALAWYVLRLRPAPGSPRRELLDWGLVGALIGLAVLTKATALPLVAVFGCVLLWRLWRRPDRGLAGLSLLAFAAAYLLTAGPYHLEALARYGQLTGMQEAVVNARRGVGLLDLLAALPGLHYGIFRNHFFYYCIAHIGGWASLLSPDWINMAFKASLECCLLSLVAVLLLRDRRAQLGRFLVAGAELPLLVCAGFAGLLYHALHSLLAWGICTTNPWYAMASQPAFFALLCLGPALLDKRVAWMCVLALVFVFNAAYLDGTYNVLLTQETGIPSLHEALTVAVAHHSLFRLDIHGMLFADVLCLFFLTTLCLERIDSAWRETRQDTGRPLSGTNGDLPRPVPDLDRTSQPLPTPWPGQDEPLAKGAFR